MSSYRYLPITTALSVGLVLGFAIGAWRTKQSARLQEKPGAWKASSSASVRGGPNPLAVVEPRMPPPVATPSPPVSKPSFVIGGERMVTNATNAARYADPAITQEYSALFAQYGIDSSTSEALLDRIRKIRFNKALASYAESEFAAERYDLSVAVRDALRDSEKHEAYLLYESQHPARQEASIVAKAAERSGVILTQEQKDLLVATIADSRAYSMEVLGSFAGPLNDLPPIEVGSADQMRRSYLVAKSQLETNAQVLMQRLIDQDVDPTVRLAVKEYYDRAVGFYDTVISRVR